jgi:integrase
MARTKKRTYSRRGEITIAVNSNRLRLRFPPTLFPDRTPKFLALGLEDSSSNRLEAKFIILKIEKDLEHDEFDISLEKYRIKSTESELMETISSIWQAYLKYKKPALKLSTFHYLKNGLGEKIANCPIQDLNDTLKFREWTIANTTNGMAKRIFTHLNAAVRWAIDNRLISLKESPFKNMSKDLPKHNWELEGNPNALSKQEISKVLDTFANHEDISISNYYLFIKFLLLTGCRPSEAIGLRVKEVSFAKGWIEFSSSIVRVNGAPVRSQGSKNNKSRKLPINSELKQLLTEAIRESKDPDSLVFTSVNDRVIQYSYFAEKIWKPIVTPLIGRRSTPYSCRDTFISHQLAEGVAASKICAWCDTSIAVVQKRYLDPLIALAETPTEIL